MSTKETAPKAPAAAVAPATPKKREGRSPNFPSISLEKAIEKAKKLDIHPVPITLLPSRWDYTNAKNSAFQQAVAALKAYGLVNVDGSLDKRVVTLSERGKRIIRNAPDREDQLRLAALTPPIIKELWEKYSHYEALPKDDIIKNFLVWEHDPAFLENSADTFIGIFRDTIRFAKLSEGGVQSENGDDEPGDIADETDSRPPEHPKPPPTGPVGGAKHPPQGGHKPMIKDTGLLTLPLPAGMQGTIQAPMGIGEAGFKKLKDKIAQLLDLYKEDIVGQDKKDDEPGE